MKMNSDGKTKHKAKEVHGAKSVGENTTRKLGEIDI